MQALQKAHDWQDYFPLSDIGQQTLVILGYGSIGQEVGRLAKVFGTRIIGVKRDPTQVTDEAKAIVNEIATFDDLDRLYAEADFIVNVLPSTPATRNLLTMQSCFSKMKKSAVLINIGRGDVLDENDLIQALTDGVISGAALDVYQTEPVPKESPLWDCPNLVMYHHNAFCNGVDQTSFEVNLILSNLERIKNGLAPQNLCDKKRGY